MSHYPQSAVGLGYITLPAGPGAVAAQLTANASANNKGAYVEFEDSTTFASNYIGIHITRGDTVSEGLTYLVDIATGAAAAEVVKIPNILYAHSNNGTSHGGAIVTLPFAIPITTRVAARIQCNVGSENLFLALTLVNTGDTPGPDAYLNYGADTGTSLGVSVDPGGTINTKGAYSQLSASTSAIIQIIQFCMTTGANTAVAASQWAYDFATGAAASEVVLIPDLRLAIASEANAGAMTGMWQSYLTFIAASTRLAIRASCDINDATDRLLSAVIIAAAAPAESSGGQRSYVG